MKKLILIGILAVLAETVIAQSFYSARMNREWIASAGSGVASYFGEVKNDGDIFHGTLYNIEAGLERRFNERISVRGNFTFFQTKGSDAVSAEKGRVPRNLSFNSINLELAFTGIIQLFPEAGRYYQRPLVNPYLFLGIGATYFNARTDLPNSLHDGTPLFIDREGQVYTKEK